MSARRRAEFLKLESLTARVRDVAAVIPHTCNLRQLLAIARMAKRAREEGTTHKLLYFDFPGKAEAIRLALTHAGVAFEDHRFADRAEFQALKASGRLQFGQVPALEVTTAATRPGASQGTPRCSSGSRIPQ